MVQVFFPGCLCFPSKNTPSMIRMISLGRVELGKPLSSSTAYFIGYLEDFFESRVSSNKNFQKSTRSRPMERLRQPFTAAARTKTKKQPKMPFRGNLLDDDGGGCFLPQRVGSDFWKLGSSKHTHFTQIFYISICTCIYVEMPTPTHAKSVFIVSYIYIYIFTYTYA